MKRFGPDSKQSWLVVVACFIVKFLSFGLVEVAGMLMIVTMHRFETTREAASLPYTLIYTIRNGSGPLIAYISNIIGIRSATLFGCVLSSIAVGVCFFAESILVVTILWGILFGFGFAFGSLLLNAIICEHFEKHVSKAIGLTSIGAGAGIIFYSPFIDMLANDFGLSAAFLIVAGFILHTIPAVIFIILNQPTKQELDIKPVQIPNANCEITSNSQDHSLRNGLNTSLAKNMVLATYRRKNSIYSQNYTNEGNGCIKTIYSMRFQENDSELIVKARTFDEDKMHNNENICCKSEKCTDISLQTKSAEQGTKDSMCEIVEPSVAFKTNCAQKDSLQGNISAKNLKPKQLMKTLFCNPVFWLILISNGMFYFCYPAFLTLLVDYSLDIGVDPSYSKYILIYSTLCEFTGCLVLGFVADLGIVSNSVFAILCFLIHSLILVLIIWVNNVVSLALCVFVFEFTMPGLLLIYPSVIADSLGKEFQSSAIASLYILAAPLDLAISPLIGYFRDERGSYAGVFLTLAGAALIGCFSQMFVLKYVNSRKQSN